MVNLEKRCLWIVRESMYNKSTINDAMEHAYYSGYDIVFVQVRGRGYALYDSNIVPKNPQVDPDFDPLDYIIRLGSSLGIEVHAWLNTYILWSSKFEPKDLQHLYHTHKNWTEADKNLKMDYQIKLSQPKSPQWEGIYLSPIHPDVNPYLLSVYSEIVNEYDVDGIHLDYIRFQDEMYGYNKFGMQQFEDMFNINPRDISRGIISTSYGWEQTVVDSMQNAWKKFQQDAISKLVENIYLNIYNSGKQIILTAAVKPDLLEAKDRWGQDWLRWLEEGYVDFIVPMNYYSEIRDFNNTIQIMKTHMHINDIQKIIIGISTYNQDAQSASDKVLLSRLNGFKGVSIFSYDAHKNNLEWFNPIIKALGLSN